MNRIFLNYPRYEHLLKEADVLLFRPKKKFSVGWWIAKYTQSPYSHVGMVSIDKVVNCIEFREFIGSRSEPLINQFPTNSNHIDVFRPLPMIKKPKIVNGNTSFHEEFDIKVFNYKTARKITDAGKRLVGQKYGWANIWKMAKSYSPFLRFWSYSSSDNDTNNIFVCSTLITYTYRTYWEDLCPFLSDNYTNPGDIARSPLLKYMFTLI